jgi:alpha-beta hydrolase superfamily lysophospholipase
MKTTVAVMLVVFLCVVGLPARTTGTPRPGVVLVTGSGAGVPREHLLTEATEFARQGVAALIYDKRTVGYTLFRRSYSELATDTLGAVDVLRAQPGVDPAKVGVWGLSEGGWVAPLAASRSSEVAFVIVVGGNAMTPIRQQLWSETSSLRRAGVSGSLIDHGKRNFTRLGADAGLFAEAYFNAQDVLERVRSRYSAYGAAVTCRPRPRTTLHCSPRLSGAAATPITPSASSPAPTTPHT